MKGPWLNAHIQTEKKSHILFSVCSALPPCQASGPSDSAPAAGCSMNLARKIQCDRWPRIKGIVMGNYPTKGNSNKGNHMGTIQSYHILWRWGIHIKQSQRNDTVSLLFHQFKTSPQSKRIEERYWDSTPSSWKKIVSFRIGIP